MPKSIVTRYKVTETGAGRIEARYGQTRRVVPYDHGSSIDRNHGEAAALVVLAVGLTAVVLDAIEKGTIVHEPDNGVHRFYV